MFPISFLTCRAVDEVFISLFTIPSLICIGFEALDRTQILACHLIIVLTVRDAAEFRLFARFKWADRAMLR